MIKIILVNSKLNISLPLVHIFVTMRIEMLLVCYSEDWPAGQYLSEAGSVARPPDLLVSWADWIAFLHQARHSQARQHAPSPPFLAPTPLVV
jgi:hypothetical protein